jgi:hypothetical protein
LRPPGQSPDPRNQHGEVERLGQVVIGAQPQALDHLSGLRRARQHQHAAADAGRDKLCADPVTVDDREVAVQDDHVVVVDLGVDEPAGTVKGDVDGHPCGPQARGDGLRQLLVVLDHKHPHQLLLVTRP